MCILCARVCGYMFTSDVKRRYQMFFTFEAKTVVRIKRLLSVHNYNMILYCVFLKKNVII